MTCTVPPYDCFSNQMKGGFRNGAKLTILTKDAFVRLGGTNYTTTAPRCVVETSFQLIITHSNATEN